MKLYCQAPRNQDNRSGTVCGAYLGQTPVDITLIAVVKERTPRIPELEPHKDVRLCRKCGWFSIYMVPEGLAKIQKLRYIESAGQK